MTHVSYHDDVLLRDVSIINANKTHMFDKKGDSLRPKDNKISVTETVDTTIKDMIEKIGSAEVKTQIIPATYFRTRFKQNYVDHDDKPQNFIRLFKIQDIEKYVKETDKDTYTICDYDIEERCFGDVDHFKKLLSSVIGEKSFFRSCYQVKLFFTKLNVLNNYFISYEYYERDLTLNPLSSYVIEFKKTFKHCDTLYRILNNEYPKILYMEHSNFLNRSTIHWGQRKLFLSEIEFLTIYYTQVKKLKRQVEYKTIFVYAGAARGDHIPFLSELFPKVHFHLYDPSKFSNKLYELDKKVDYIKVYNEYFTDDVAKKWVSEKFTNTDVLFVSDIRINTNTEGDSPSDDDIAINMEWQKKWYSIIKPFLTMYKFKLPYNNNITEYIKGVIYFQVWAPISSSETRLLIFGPKQKMINYYNRTYEENLAYFSVYGRKQTFTTGYDKKILDIGYHDDRYDSMAEISILENYYKLSNIEFSQEDIMHFSNKISKEISSWRTLKHCMPLSPGELAAFSLLKSHNKMQQDIAETRVNLNKTITPEILRFISENMDELMEIREEIDKKMSKKR